MNDIPVEVLDRIISNLPCSDLCSIRLTCKGFSVRAAPLVFEFLHLSARPAQLNYPIVGPLSLSHPHWDDRVGRSRTTNYCDLTEVFTILQPTVAPLVKTLIFSPAWFRSDLWNDHNQFRMFDNIIEVQLLRDANEGRARPSHYYSKKRQLEGEALVLPQAKRTWGQLLVRQSDSSGNIRAAVTSLLANMSRLENIVLTDRTQLLKFIGIDLNPDELYNCSRKQERSNTWRFFSVLARGLHANNRNIRTLAMYNLNTLDLAACIATNHAFTGLTKLSLSISDSDLLLRRSSTLQANSLTGFLKYSAPTLQYLSLNFSWENHRDYTRYTPSLGPIFARPIPGSPAGAPLIFPQLLEVKLRMLSIDTAALTHFLRHQPVLRKATFDALLLSVPGTTWNDVASALPCSVESWQVRNVSKPKPNRPDQCLTWNPLVETLNRTTGWEWDKDDFLHQHQLDATSLAQLSDDRLSYLKLRHRFSTTKFARINNAADSGA